MPPVLAGLVAPQCPCECWDSWAGWGEAQSTAGQSCSPSPSSCAGESCAGANTALQEQTQPCRSTQSHPGLSPDTALQSGAAVVIQGCLPALTWFLYPFWSCKELHHFQAGLAGARRWSSCRTPFRGTGCSPQAAPCQQDMADGERPLMTPVTLPGSFNFSGTLEHPSLLVRRELNLPSQLHLQALSPSLHCSCRAPCTPTLLPAPQSISQSWQGLQSPGAEAQPGTSSSCSQRWASPWQALGHSSRLPGALTQQRTFSMAQGRTCTSPDLV